MPPPGGDYFEMKSGKIIYPEQDYIQCGKYKIEVHGDTPPDIEANNSREYCRI